MTWLIAAVFGGAAANQLDEACKLFKDDWELIVRYVIGVTTIMFSFFMMLRHLRPDAVRDGMLAFVGAAFGTGGGVFLARCWKDIINRVRA